jgi:hypothetical protein
VEPMPVQNNKKGMICIQLIDEKKFLTMLYAE